MKILVTGGCGFIGSHLAKKYIEKGAEVTILSRSRDKIRNIRCIEDKVNLLIGDLRDVDKEVEGTDCIFHFAGSTDNYAIREGQPYRDIESNCNTTIALLEACRKHAPNSRIVFPSTFFVNGNVKKLPVNVSSPCNPLGLYPATRLAAEHFCHIYHNVYGLDTVVARLTNVFGPFEQGQNKKKAGFNYLINLAVKGKDIPVYNNGDFFRDYIYVTDVAEACMTIAEKGEIDHTYYVGRGEFVKFRELVNIIARETGVKIVPIEPPEFHKQVGIRDFVCDNSDLRALGWTPKVSVEEGIKKTIKYYRGIQNGRP